MKNENYHFSEPKTNRRLFLCSQENLKRA